MRKTNYFKSSLMVLLFFIGLTSLWGQGTETIFTESMGTVSSNTTIVNHESANGFDNDAYLMTSGGATNPADIRNTSNSSGYSGSSGGANVWFAVANAQYGFAIEGIDASGYSDLKLSFAVRKEGGSGTAFATFAVEYWNGSSYQSVTLSGLPSSSNSTGWYLIENISLPTEAAINGLRLRFLKSGSIGCRLDDVKLVGTPLSSNTPNITVSATALNPFTYVQGNGPSAAQSFTASGVNLDSDVVTVTAPANYEVSLDNVAFAASQQIPYTGDSFTDQNLYVRLVAGLAAGTYNGSISISGGGDATPATKAFVGTVTSPPPANDLCENATTLSVNSSPVSGTLANSTLTGSFSRKDVWYAITPTYNETYTITVSNYSGDVDVELYQANCPSDTSELIDDATNGGSNPEVIDYNLVQGTTYYVRVIAWNTAAENTFNIQVTAPAPPSPTISANPTTLNMNAQVGASSNSDITITGTLLTGDINIVKTGNAFTVNTNTLPSGGGVLTVTYSPSAAGIDAGTITLASADATDVVITLNGTATLSTPVAIAATDIDYAGFTANWNSVAGAESYEIDVYTKEESEPTPVTVVGWNFGDSNATADSGTQENSARTISTNASSPVYSNVGSNPGGIAANSPGSGWSNGSGNKYWQVSFTTTGTNNLKLSSRQRSSNAGPRDFKVQYSLDNSSWTDVPSSTVVLTGGNNWTSLSNISLPITCENQPLVYLRWIMTSNTRANGDSGATSGDSAIDDILIIGDQGGVSIEYIDGYENLSVNDTSKEITDLDPETNYYYVVRAKAGVSTTANSNEISVITEALPTAITWTGTAWSNGTGPSTTEPIFVDGDLIIGNSAEADMATLETGELTITQNGSILIESGHFVIVNGKITNEAGAENFIVASGANLIQDETYTANDNVGDITVQRESQDIVRLDYTLWSSPVTGQQLQDFSPQTLPNRIYTYETTAATEATNGGYVVVPSVTDDFENGKGYLFRAPNTWGTTPAPYAGEFVGVPFNGNVTLPVYPTKYTSVGNPYPSNIDSELFMAANGNVSTLYFWNNTGQAGMNYATYTTLGGSPAGGGSETPTDFISVGQGFLVESSSSSVTFNNEMRVSDATIFFKENTVEKHRFWLSLNNESNQNLNNILVGYMSGATQGVDNQIDGKQFASQGSALYSIISQEKFAIQGRALPFENTDVVTLGFQAAEAGKFNISLSNFDGLFTEGEVIVYLKDKQLDITHNLMESSYTFESAAGEFKERFEVVYQTEGTMGIGDLASAAVLIYKNNQNIVVESKNEKILSVELFDLSGRNIHSNNKVNANTYQIKSNAQGVLVVKVQTQNGEVVTKKVINK